MMYFVHLMWQEFLVAVYFRLYTQIHKEKDVLIKMSSDKYQMVTLFLFGLCNKETLDDLLDCVELEEGRNTREDRESCKQIVKQYSLKLLQKYRDFSNYFCIEQFLRDFSTSEIRQQRAKIRGLLIPMYQSSLKELRNLNRDTSDGVPEDGDHDKPDDDVDHVAAAADADDADDVDHVAVEDDDVDHVADEFDLVAVEDDDANDVDHVAVEGDDSVDSVDFENCDDVYYTDHAFFFDTNSQPSVYGSQQHFSVENASSGVDNTVNDYINDAIQKIFKRRPSTYFGSILPLLGWVREFGNHAFTKQAASCLRNKIEIKEEYITPSDVLNINHILRQSDGVQLRLNFERPPNLHLYFFKELQSTLNKNDKIQVSCQLVLLDL